MSDDALTALVSGSRQSPEQIAAIVQELKRNRARGEYAQMTGDEALRPFGTSLLSDVQEQEHQLGAQAQKNQSDDLAQKQFERLLGNESSKVSYQDRDLQQRLDIAKMEDQTKRDIASGRGSTSALQSSDQSTIDAIGKYHQAPLQNRGSPRAMAIMDEVNNQYPDYDANVFTARKKAESDFGTGAKGDMMRSADVAIQHLDTADELGSKLQNTRYPMVNSAINYFKSATGSPDVKNFNTAKALVSDEVNKFIQGGAGALADRKGLQDQLDAANSAGSLKGVTDTLRTLMSGQMHGLRSQYGEATGKDDFESRLSPRTVEALGLTPPKPPAQISALPGATGGAVNPGGNSMYNPGALVQALKGNISGPPQALGPGGQLPPSTPQPTPQAPQGTPSGAAQQPIPVRSMPQAVPGVTIVRRGTRNGKKVAQLSNGQVVDLD